MLRKLPQMVGSSILLGSLLTPASLRAGPLGDEFDRRGEEQLQRGYRADTEACLRAAERKAGSRRVGRYEVPEMGFGGLPYTQKMQNRKICVVFCRHGKKPAAASVECR